MNINGVVLSRHEVLAAQPAREMLSDGHWIVPTFAGVPRVNKPPTTGWLIAASILVFGGETEWIARLPAILCGVLTAALTAAIAARALGNQAGLIAGLTTATSYYVLMQARLSEADMPMAACVTAAMLVFARAIDRARPPATHAVLFHLLSALSFLLKGVGPVFILLPCLVYSLLRRDWNALRLVLHPIGLAVFFVVAASWPLAAWWTYPPIAEAWHRELFQRVSGELGEQIGRSDPWHLYFWSVPLLLLPWFPLTVIGAVAGIRRRWWRTPIGSLLMCWFGCGFVLLSVISWRNKHYAIPIAPACAAATAAGFVLWIRHSISRPAREGRVVQTAFVLTLAAGVVTALTLPKLDDRYWIAALAATLGAGGGIVIEMLIRRRPTAATVAVFATAWLLIAAAYWQFVPKFDGYRPSTEFARRVNALVPADQGVYLVGLGEHHVAYYLQRRMTRIDDPALAGRRITGEPAYVLAAAGAEASLRPIGGVTAVDAVTHLSRRQTPADRLTLFRIDPAGASTRPDR